VKKVAYLFTLIVLFAGCSSKPIPDWTNAAFNRLGDYKKYYLSGKTDIAELNFKKAVEEIKKSGDLEILGRAYLTKYALQTAVLDKIDEDEYLKIDAVSPSSSNTNFYNFLKGNLDHVEGKELPGQYQAFFGACRSGKFTDASGEISKIEDPLSRLIAAGLLVRNDKCDEECLKIAIDTASKNGWKRALLVYLERLQSFYENGKDLEKATYIRKKIELIRS
jgi:hypothetical protein